MNSIVISLLSWILFVGATNLSHAATLEDATFPETISIKGKTLILNGMGLRTKKIVLIKVKVYAAALYLESKTNQREQVLTDGKLKKLDLHFLHDVSKEKLIDAWKEAYEKNCDSSLMNCNQVPQLLEKMSAALSEVKKGDRLQLTFLPSDIVIQTRNSPEIQISGGSDFSKIALSAWFGKSPPNEDLQEGLLGKTPSP